MLQTPGKWDGIPTTSLASSFKGSDMEIPAHVIRLWNEVDVCVMGFLKSLVAAFRKDLEDLQSLSLRDAHRRVVR